MENVFEINGNPLSGLDYRFENYVSQKKAFNNKHMDGNGLPNYAYKMDYEHRKHLDSIPGLMRAVKTYCATIIPQQLQTYNMQGVMVGPNQFPEIYKMVTECANTLGIGIPNVLIVPNIGGEEFNAVTYALDDIEPLILVTGLMVERMSSEQLKAIIAHECGHIHNQHGLYGVLENIITMVGSVGLASIPGINLIAPLLTSGVRYAVDMWSRAAEVTADRAAVICAGSPKIAGSALAKFMYNGANISGVVESEINLEPLREQLDMMLNNPNRLNELFSTHPLPLKRIFAVHDFAECEVFYNWRPDLKKAGQTLYTKEQTDEKCKKYIDVVMPKGAKK